MWKNFYTSTTDFLALHHFLEEWKKAIFEEESVKVKKYFAHKVVVHFDNLMIFHQKKGLHNNLLDSLSQAQKEMDQCHGVFKPVSLYVVKEDHGYCILTCGLEPSVSVIEKARSHDVILSEQVLGNPTALKSLAFHSWSTLAFDIELVNFSQTWINFTPPLEVRSKLQAQHILCHMNFKNTEVSLLDKIRFEENITSHPQYQELLDKVMKVMPKIETLLEQEWRTAPFKDTRKEVKEVAPSTLKGKKGK